MTIGVNLRIGLVGALAALALAMVPLAQATAPVAGATAVCNEAGAAFTGGTLNATGGDPATPARNQTALKALPGKGAGLARAAANSPALSACSGLAQTPPPPPANPGGGGGDTGPGAPVS